MSKKQKIEFATQIIETWVTGLEKQSQNLPLCAESVNVLLTDLQTVLTLLRELIERKARKTGFLN